MAVSPACHARTLPAPVVTPNRLLPIAFGMTHAGKSLLWAGTDAFSLFILIKIVRISPVEAGMLFVLSSFWNATADGLWGNGVDRVAAIRTALPRLCGLASVLACLSFAILPWLPVGSMLMPAAALFLFRTMFSLLDVPHNATAAVLANMHGHLVVARWRSILGAVTAIIVGAAALPMIGAAAAAPGMAQAMFMAIAVVACLLLAPLPWLVRMTRHAGVARHHARDTAPAVLPANGLALFCLAQMLGFAALASIGKAILHADALHDTLFDYALLLLTLARLAAIGLWSPLAAQIGSARALGLAYVASAAAALCLPAAIGQGLAGTMMILSLLGLSFGGVILLAWSSFSELLAKMRMGDDPAVAARAYGWFTATSKIGLGFSGLLTGAWLSQAGGAAAPSLWSLIIPVAALCLASALMAWPGLTGKARRLFGRLRFEPQ